MLHNPFIASLAKILLVGVLKLAAEGATFAGQTVVCIITGHGLKDPEAALATEPPLHRVPADVGAVERALGW